MEPTARIPLLGTAAILSGLSLNILFLEAFAVQLDVARNPASSVVFLMFASALLIYGLFWAPARAAERGLTLQQYLAELIGSTASRIACWVLAPIAIGVWFDGQWEAAVLFAESIQWGLGVERGSFWREPWVIVLVLTFLIFLGVRDRLIGFARSSFWLAKIGLVALVGLLISYWDAIPAGIQRVAQNPYTRGDDYVEAMGILLYWFAVPLFFVSTLWRPGPERQSASPPLHQLGWFGIGMPLATASILSSLIFVGLLGTLPKVLGFHFAFYSRGPIGAGKLLVASLSLLIALRLAPRLLLELWRIPPHTLKAAALFGILVAASLANDRWLLISNPLVASLAVVSLAGVAAGAEAGTRAPRRFVASMQSLAHTPHGASGRLTKWRAAAWLLGLLTSLAVAGEIIHAPDILHLAWNGEFSAAGWQLLVDLYGLHDVMGAADPLDNSMNFKAAVWAWCLCFLTSLVLEILSPSVCVNSPTPPGQPTNAATNPNSGV